MEALLEIVKNRFLLDLNEIGRRKKKKISYKEPWSNELEHLDTLAALLTDKG